MPNILAVVSFVSALVAVSRADFIGYVTRDGACDTPVLQTGAYYNGCSPLLDSVTYAKSVAVTCTNASYATLIYYDTTTCSGGVLETINDFKIQPWGCTPRNGDKLGSTFTCSPGAFEEPPDSVVQNFYPDQTTCPQQGVPYISAAGSNGVCFKGFRTATQSARYSSNASSITLTIYNTTTCSGPVVELVINPLGCSAPQRGGLIVWRVTGPAPSSNTGPSPAVISGAVGGTIAALAALGGVFYYVKARPHTLRQAESVKLLG